MTPDQRRRAFAETLTLPEIDDNLESSNGVLGQTMKGGRVPFRSLMLRDFRWYTSATAALGLASGMAGVTLPFAIYTGMTSFISVIIGPVGWVAFGSAIAWKSTSSEWNRLRIALLYIITVRHEMLQIHPHRFLPLNHEIYSHLFCEYLSGDSSDWRRL